MDILFSIKSTQCTGCIKKANCDLFAKFHFEMKSYDHRRYLQLFLTQEQQQHKRILLKLGKASACRNTPFSVRIHRVNELLEAFQHNINDPNH